MYIWVFLEEDHSKEVIDYLLSRGLSIRAPSENHRTVLNRPHSTVVVLGCDASSKVQVRDALINRLTEEGILCYGMVLADDEGYLWTGSNDLQDMEGPVDDYDEEGPQPPIAEALQGVDDEVDRLISKKESSEPNKTLFDHLEEDD